MEFKVAFVCLLVVCSVSCRSIQRSGDGGNVNLVEFNVRGVTYGRCIFSSPEGEEIAVMYEERGDEISARSSNPTVLDPASQAVTCRQVAASQPLNSGNSARSGLEERPETDRELMMRYTDFTNRMRSNEEYVAYLQPRFISLLGSLLGSGLDISTNAGQSQKLGLSFSSIGDQNSGGIFPGYNLMNANPNGFASLGVDSNKKGLFGFFN